MKTILIRAFAYTCLLASSLVAGITEDSIRGQWKFKFTEDAFTKSAFTSFLPKGEYRENGTIAVTVAGREQKPNIPFRIRGSWELDKETVVVTVSHSTAPDFIQVGSILRFNINKVTDTEIFYEATPEGTIYRAPRTDNP